MYSCHNTAVFIVVARAACGLQVPTLRRPQDGRKWSAGKFKDMSAHQRDEAHNGGCTPESVLNYLEIWIRRPSSIYMAFSRGLGVKNQIEMPNTHANTRVHYRTIFATPPHPASSRIIPN